MMGPCRLCKPTSNDLSINDAATACDLSQDSDAGGSIRTILSQDAGTWRYDARYPKGAGRVRDAARKWSRFQFMLDVGAFFPR